METINGEWYMKGCSADDPDCLHSASDLKKLIRKIGFLPLLSNEILGFSVEEHTQAVNWWCGVPEIDPWEWIVRQIRKHFPGADEDAIRKVAGI